MTAPRRRGKRPARIFTPDGRMIQGQPARDLIAAADDAHGNPVLAVQRPGPGGWWVVVTAAEDAPGAVAVVVR